MKIKKKDGNLQEFMPNKILQRIKSQAKGLKVNPVVLFQEVIPMIMEGMSTTDIDTMIAFKAADKIVIHPDYSILGGRILMSRQSKLIGRPLQPVDETYDLFAAETFLSKYSKKNGLTPIELPSDMYERVSKELSKDEDEYQMMLNELLLKRINFATPIYTNCGIDKRGSMISCNLTHLESDDMVGIQNTITKIASASKEGAGIGLLIDNLRSKYSLVSSFNGYASGVTRFADMVQATMRFYKQGSRAGSCALYLSVWHRDIIDFLNLTLPIGDEFMRMRDLFTSVVINDLFMKKLISNETWYLFCPQAIEKAGLKPFYELWGEAFEEEYNKAVSLGIGYAIEPRQIWDAIIKSQIESGKPYVFFKDNANKRNMQRNIGVIKQSNLCISENSIVNILIDDKEHKVDIKTAVKLFEEGKELLIKSYDIENDIIEYRKILNGLLTSKNKTVIHIFDEDSKKELFCTPKHEIYTINRGFVKAKDLTSNDILKILL